MSEDACLFKLKQVLTLYKERCGSWSRVANAIEKANAHSFDSRIDQRTLEKLCGEDCEGVKLKLGQLKAIDSFFSANGEGSLFDRSQSILDLIAESPTVNFLVASRFHSRLQTEAISRWDLRAITRLLRTRLGGLRVKIWDIMEMDDWQEIQNSTEGEAQISIGSPIANLASDALLCEMIGLGKKDHCDQNALPFYIVKGRHDRFVDSVFVRKKLDAIQRDPLAPERIKEFRGLIVGNDRIYTPESRYEDYVVLVAQRHPRHGRMRIVLCGLTGPSTYASAKFLYMGGQIDPLPGQITGEPNPPILVVVFKVAIDWPEDRKKAGRESRRLGNIAMVRKPALFYCRDGCWQDSPENAGNME